MDQRRDVLESSRGLDEQLLKKHHIKNTVVILERLEQTQLTNLKTTDMPPPAVKTEPEESLPLVFNSLRDLCNYGFFTQGDEEGTNQCDDKPGVEETCGISTSVAKVDSKNDYGHSLDDFLCSPEFQNLYKNPVKERNTIVEQPERSGNAIKAIEISPIENSDLNSLAMKEDGFSEEPFTSTICSAEGESHMLNGNGSEKPSVRMLDPILIKIKKEFDRSDPVFPCEDSSITGTVSAAGSASSLFAPKTEPSSDVNSESGFSVNAVSIFDTVSRIKQEKDIIYEVPPEEHGEIQSEINNFLSVNAVDNAAVAAIGAFTSLRDLATSFTETRLKSQRTKRRKRYRGKKLDVYKCKKCSYSSKCRGDLSKHSKYVHGESVHLCPVKGCDFKTKFPNNIRHHLRSHSNVRPFACPDCSSAFKTKDQLNTHSTTHSDARPFQCSQCSFSAKRNWILTSHIATKHSDERKYECDICGFKMKTRSDINKHKKTHIKERKYRCSVCDKCFKFQSSLHKHRKYMHDVCELIPCTREGCDRKFKVKRDLLKHVKTIHEGIKDFECDVCSRRFSNKNNLDKHLLTHDSTNRPFMCPLCPYRGEEEYHVLTHIGSMHGKLRLFNCTLCHVRFKSRQHLRQHLATEKHRRNLKFALPPNDNEVDAEPEKLDKDAFVEYPEIRILSVKTSSAGKRSVKLEKDDVETPNFDSKENKGRACRGRAVKIESFFKE